MRRIIPFLAAVGATCSLCLVPMGSASAFGAEQVKCAFGPPILGYSTNCEPTSITNPDSISFQVMNESGSGYSFAWTLSGSHSVFSGCTSTTDFCSVTSRSSSDHEVIASVVISQNGSSETSSATADVIAVCGRVFC
jgi:hypothetical protein